MRQTEDLWVDKYKPQSLAELAVHKKKVDYFLFVHIVCIVCFIQFVKGLLGLSSKVQHFWIFFSHFGPWFQLCKLPGL
jgi:hypothetical protein